jgi:hypothetical protein
MDIEALEAFIDRFFGEVIAPLNSNNLVSVYLGSIHHCHVYSDSPIMLKNNVQSHYLLKSKVLSSSLASHIRMNEDIHDIKCYFHYIIF